MCGFLLYGPLLRHRHTQPVSKSPHHHCYSDTDSSAPAYRWLPCDVLLTFGISELNTFPTLVDIKRKAHQRHPSQQLCPLQRLRRQDPEGFKRLWRGPGDNFVSAPAAAPLAALEYLANTWGFLACLAGYALADTQVQQSLRFWDCSVR